MTVIKWNGDAVKKDATQKAWQRVMAAGTYLKAQSQRNVDIATAAAGPSKPGEFPHKVTGTLQKEIFLRKHEGEVAVDVGTALVYGVHWELTNRPYIRRTYAERLGEIKDILEGRFTQTIEDVREQAAEMKERHAAQKVAITARRAKFKAVKREFKAARKAAVKIKTPEAKARVERAREALKAARKERTWKALTYKRGNKG